MVISKAAPPTFGGIFDQEDTARIISEVKRILKDGGEFRFGPARLQIIDVSMPHEPSVEEVGGKEEHIRKLTERDIESVERSYEFLRNIDPEITIADNGMAIKDFGDDPPLEMLYARGHYYSLIKNPEKRTGG